MTRSCRAFSIASRARRESPLDSARRDPTARSGAYLEQERPGAGSRLHGNVREIVDLLRAHARVFPRVPGIDEGEVRRALTGRRGYWLIFEIDERAGEVVILALRHSRRRPGGWRRR